MHQGANELPEGGGPPHPGYGSYPGPFFCLLVFAFFCLFIFLNARQLAWVVEAQPGQKKPGILLRVKVWARPYETWRAGHIRPGQIDVGL